MPLRRDIPYNEGLFYVTFTCYKWLPLIEKSNAYECVYKWFDYLVQHNHQIVGFVIMPNHVHALINFSNSVKKLNTIIGDGKRFMAYDIINRLKDNGQKLLLNELKMAVSEKDRKSGHRHEVWEESFDWKFCETPEFAYQKLVYIHNNPCIGKWKLAEDITRYEHSSARYYITGKHAGYLVTDLENVLAKIINSKHDL